jgi:hypothetical protein
MQANEGIPTADRLVSNQAIEMTTVIPNQKIALICQN